MSDVVELDADGLRALGDQHRRAAEQLAGAVSMLIAARHRTAIDDPAVARLVVDVAQVERAVSLVATTLVGRAGQLARRAAATEELARSSPTSLLDDTWSFVTSTLSGVVDEVGDAMADVVHLTEDLLDIWDAATGMVDSLLTPFTTDLRPFRATAPPLPAGPLEHVAESTTRFDLSVFVTAGIEMHSNVDRAADGSIVVTLRFTGAAQYRPGDGGSAWLGNASTADETSGELGLATRHTLTYVFADRTEFEAWEAHMTSEFGRLSPVDVALRPVDRLVIAAAGPPSAHYLGAGLSEGASIARGSELQTRGGVEIHQYVEHDVVGHLNRIEVSATVTAGFGIGSPLSALAAGASIDFDGTMQLRGTTPTSVNGTFAVEVGATTEIEQLRAVVDDVTADEITRGLIDGRRYRIEWTVNGDLTHQSLADFLRHPTGGTTVHPVVYEITQDSTDGGAGLGLDEFGRLGLSYHEDHRTLTRVGGHP